MNLYFYNPVCVENGGFFISNGKGRHPSRVIDSYELIFVHSGCLAMREANHNYILEPGSFLLLHPGLYHEGITDYAADLKFYWVHFTFFPRGDATSNHIFHISKQGVTQSLERTTELFNFFLREQENENDKESLDLVLLLILEQLGKTNQKYQPKQGAHLAHHAKIYITVHYREKLTPSSIASKMRCNVDYLGRVFKSVFNVTLTQYILQKKLSAAKKMLIEGKLSINAVAAILGFSDVSYFRRVFIKNVGVRPLAYKKLYAIKHINSA